MNIDSVISKIKLFDELVINSGFKRDVSDYMDAIQQNQTIAFMEDFSKRVQNWFEDFEKNSLDSELTSVLTRTPAFTSQGIAALLQELDSNKTIEPPAYFQELMQILNDLNSLVDDNETEIEEIRNIFERYASDKIDSEAEEGKALVSLVFKDVKTIKEFSRTLANWNKALLMFHQLVKSESPEEISLIQIQNSSIDVILNIDVNVYVDLYKVMTTSLVVYLGYLSLKTKRAEIVETFCGDEELIELEKKIEKRAFENIKMSVQRRVAEIHQERLQEDPEIVKEAIEKKIECVSATIIDHIVSGNDIKLLSAPQSENEQDDEEDISKELRKKTVAVREQYEKLSQEDKRLLLEKYSVKDEDNENEKSDPSMEE